MQSSYPSTRTSIDPQHAQEFIDSAIAEDIAALNFRSFDGEDETELDEIFTLLVSAPNHNNNGTLSGTSQNQLAATLRSGGWIFEGYKGMCFKPSSPRIDKHKDRTIKYESPRGVGSQQLFIPKVSVRAGLAIATKIGSSVAKQYLDRVGNLDPSSEDTDFWSWFESKDFPLIVSEGAKKASALISAGYAAIALSGIWGWGKNVKDVYEAVEKGDDGRSLKEIHPDLELLLNGREIVFALDRDILPKTISMVNAAKSAFARSVEGDTEITDLEWRSPKGIDDYILTKGIEALDRIYTSRKKIEKVKPSNPERVSTGDTLLQIAKTAKYFHTAVKVAYADIWIGGSRHTYAVRSRAYRLWLSGEYLDKTGKGISSQILQDTLNTVEAIAIFQSESHEVHLRTAEHEGKIYLDLGTADWKAVEIDAHGWRLVSEPHVRFWRPESLLPLPYPVEGGELEELKEFINVDRSSWILLVTFLLFSFMPKQTYPVLVVSAHRGSGKTAAAEIIKGLIDPGKAPLIKLQGDTHKLAVSASRRLLMVYDNVGYISADQSDDICRMATNFGYSTRTLHTTDEETTFEFARPQIITAIDALVTRDDLADRVLMAQLGEITESQRIPQSELNANVEAARPRILGALLTALSQTLAELPHTNPDKLPRMADYAKFAIASEKSLGLEDGEFMTIFEESREQTRQIVIESSPVGEAIIRLMEKTDLVWKGTASELLKELESYTDESTYRSRHFPKAANLLKRQLTRLTPDLKAVGIEVREGIRSNSRESRTIVLEKVVKVSSTSSTNENESPERIREKALGVDDTAKKYRPLIVHSPESIVHSSSTREESSVSGRYISSTNKVSSTYRPLKEPIQGKGLNGVVDDVDDVDDTFTTFSSTDDRKQNSQQLLKIGDRVKYTVSGQVGTIENIGTKLTPSGRKFIRYEVNFGSEKLWLEPVVLKLGNYPESKEEEVIDCDDF